MSVRDILRFASRWWLPCLAAILVAGFAAFIVTRQLTPMYRSTATLLVNQAQTPGVVTYQDILGSQQLTKTYAELATSNINLERAAASLNDGTTASELQQSVSASPTTGTQLIAVNAEHADPDVAALYANTVAQEFIGYINEAQRSGAVPDGEEQLQLNTVFVAADARPAGSPFSPNTTLNVIGGAIAGLIVAVCAAALFEYLNDRVRGRDEIEALDTPFLGGVVLTPPPKPYQRNGQRNGQNGWLPRPGEDQGLLESVRQVQANLSFSLSATNAKVVLVTSPNPGDGKSTVAASLASTIAESSRKVLLLDGDLRKPDIHRYFSVPNASGLSTAVVAPTSDPGSFVKGITDLLYVLTGGPTPPNPTQLISLPRMREIFEQLRSQFDTIIIDGPPLLGIADALHWATLADGVILVARNGTTRQGQLSEAVKRIEASHTNLLGVVVNGVPRSTHKDLSYYYGYPRKEKPSSEDSATSHPRPVPNERTSMVTDD